MFSKIILSCDSHVERLHGEDFSLESSCTNSDRISDFIIFYQEKIGKKGNRKSLKGDKERTNSNSKNGSNSFILSKKIGKK